MSQALPCVLLRFEGPFSRTLFRDSIDSVCSQEPAFVQWVTDAVLPMDTEASENYVWNTIARRLGTNNDQTELRCLLHGYSCDRTLVAITGHAPRATDQSLLALIQSGIVRYADALGQSIRPSRNKDVCLGTELCLPPADWSWRGMSQISDEVLRLMSACYICLQLFTGYPQISLDFLEPPDKYSDKDKIYSLSVALKGDMPIGEVQQKLQIAHGNASRIIWGTKLSSLGILIGQTPSSPNRSFQIGDLKVAITDKQRLAPWAVKLMLPPIGSALFPRLESTVPLETASALLTHVYDSIASVPHIPISDVTIARGTQTVAEVSEASARR